MSQNTSGIRAILASPVIYEAFQHLMGAKALRASLVHDYIKPKAGMSLLDIGCGPATILEHLPSINYWGIDASQTYIDLARRKYGDRGRFFVGRLKTKI